MEVSGYIKDLLGLSNEDFTRAVVLPQNSFQDFLLLDNKDRRGMLERIFYLEEYGKQLWDKLGRKMAGLKSQLDRLSGELMGYADASDEALEEAKKAMNAAAAERTRVEKELKLLEIKFNEAKEVWSLVQELADFNLKEEMHTAAKDTVAEKRLKLERALKSDGLLEMIQKNNELNNKLKDTEKQLGEVQAVLPGVITGMNETKVKYEGVKTEAAIEQPKLVGLRTRLVDALGIRAGFQLFP
jgi:exonuclease SbcC